MAAQNSSSQPSPPPGGEGLVVATRSGRVLFADSTARRYLREAFPRPERAGLLPRKIRRWLQTEGKTRRGHSLRTKVEGGHLFLRCLRPHPRGAIPLFFEMLPTTAVEKRRQHRSLSPREQGAMYWAAHGKETKEIAEKMRIKIGTVEKHLERAFTKLGATNRTAAAIIYLREWGDECPASAH